MLSLGRLCASLCVCSLWLLAPAYAFSAQQPRIALVARSASEGSDAVPSVWDSMKNDELRAHLKRRGLKVSGKKAELVQRL